MSLFNFWNWDKNKEMVGILKGQFKAVGQFKKNVFIFETDEGIYHSWSYVQLMNLFHDVPFGTKIKLKYLGMEKMPDSPRLFKNFEVEILEPPVKKEKKQ